MTPELVLELWESFKDYIPIKERFAVCYRYIEILEDNGINLEDLSSVHGEDKYIDKIIKEKYPPDVDNYNEDEWEE